MSEFSQLLSDHIHNKKITIYALAQYCNIDRSSIYKIIRGKRLPSNISTIERISDFIHLTPLEHQELLEAYQITLVGADHYYRRKDVMDFLTDFAKNTSSVPIQYSIPNFTEHFPEVSTLSNSFEVTQCVTSLMLKETSQPNGQIDLLIQPDFSPAIDVLSHIKQTTNPFSVNHIISFNNTIQVTPSKKDYNLHCLQSILPLYNCCYQYQSFYYYDNILSHTHAFQVFPYMILTSGYAILLSSDTQKGMVFKQPEILHFFRNIFSEYKAASKPLLQQIENPVFLLNYIAPILSKATSVDYSFQMIPCLTHLIPSSFLRKYLCEEFVDKNVLISLFQEHQSILKQRHENSNSVFFFSEDGIRTFLETGRFVEYPEILYKPFEQKDCIFLIQQMLHVKNQFRYKMLKENIGSIPYGANIYIGQSSGYLMFVDSEAKQHIFLNIEEPGLLSTFQDFFETMDDTLFYTDEEVTARLSSLIEQYTISS